MVKELPGRQTVPPCGNHLEAGEVHDRLDEDGVVTDVRVLCVELGERAEERTAASDVHLAHGSLEGRGSDIGTKGVDDMLPVALVQQHQSHLRERKQYYPLFGNILGGYLVSHNLVHLMCIKCQVRNI